MSWRPVSAFVKSTDLNSIEHRDGFDLRRLREHIEWLHRDYTKLVSQPGQIAGESGRVAGDIDQPVGRPDRQSIGDPIVQALRRRIENDRVRLAIQKEGFNRLGNIAAEVCLMRTRRLTRGANRRLVPIDADHRLQSFGHGVPKKTGSAVGVDQHLADYLAGDKFQERPGNKIVGLGECARHFRSAQGPVLPLRKASGPKLSQRLVHSWNSDRATFNIYYVPAVFFKKPNPALCRMNGDPVSESIRLGGTQGGQYFDIGDAADSLQELENLAAFQFQLMKIGDMLVIAAAATTKIRANRVNPLVGANGYLSKLRPIKALPVLNDFGFDLFSIDRKRYENDFSVEPTHACSAEPDVMNLESDRRMRCCVRL
jgi:hypothetical protein